MDMNALNERIANSKERKKYLSAAMKLGKALKKARVKSCGKYENIEENIPEKTKHDFYENLEIYREYLNKEGVPNLSSLSSRVKINRTVSYKIGQFSFTPI